MTDEEERDRAYGNWSFDHPRILARQEVWCSGFDAGVAHERKRWNVIETDGLPTDDFENEELLVQCLGGNNLAFWSEGQFHDIHASLDITRNVVAWKELPAPYSKDGGRRDD